MDEWGDAPERVMRNIRWIVAVAAVAAVVMVVLPCLVVVDATSDLRRQQEELHQPTY